MQYHRLPKIEELRAYETHKIRDWKNVFSMSSDEGQMFVKDFHARWMSEDRKTYVIKTGMYLDRIRNWMVICNKFYLKDMLWQSRK